MIPTASKQPRTTAFLPAGGVYLLEMNLSCNLFNGTFDSKQFYDDMFTFLSALDALHKGQHRSWGPTLGGYEVKKVL